MVSFISLLGIVETYVAICGGGRSPSVLRHCQASLSASALHVNSSIERVSVNICLRPWRHLVLGREIYLLGNYE